MILLKYKLLLFKYKIFFITLFFLFNLTSLNLLAQIIKFEEIYINCDSSEFAYINENYSQDIYIYGSVTHNNKTYDSVRIRIRGDDSRKFPLKSLKIKFDKEPFANGRTTLNLNADWLDYTFIHTYLSSRVFNDLGYPCFKTGYAKVFLNGGFYSYFIMVENVDEEFLNARGMTTNCNLYKAAKDGSCLSIYDDFNIHWEKKIGDLGNFDDLRELINMLNFSPDASFKDSLLKYFDYDKLLDILAINFFIQNRSTYYHNYFMYHDLEKDKWIMLPWDLDKSSGHYNFWQVYTEWGYAHTHANPLIERALANDDVFSDLQQRLADLSKSYYNDTTIHPIIDSLEKALEPVIFQDTIHLFGTVEEWKKRIDYDRFHVHFCYQITADQFLLFPRNFHIETKNFPEINSKIKFTWQKARSPRNRKVTYTLHISPSWDHNVPEAFKIQNITDTCFILDTLLPPRTYYYYVSAVDSIWIQQSYDHLNLIQVKKANKIPCNIDSKITLTKADSPYYIDCPVNISTNGELNVEPGVEILVLDTFPLISYGTIKFNGTKEEPITLKVKPDVSKPFLLKLLDNSSSYFNYCNLTSSHLFANNSKLHFINSSIDCSNNSIIFDNILNAWNSMILIDSSEFLGNGNIEGIIAWYSDIWIANSLFNYINDAVELISLEKGVIEKNKIFNSNDDAIDLNNSKDCSIIKNEIININDKGISIGDKSKDILVKRNTIVGCGNGIAIKDSSSSIIENNTFHNNSINIHCYEKNSGKGGGNASVRNCIFSKTNDKLCIYDSLSDIFITYSLADNELISGTGNIKANPEFIDANKLNFKLKRNSPCINKGDPNSEPDPDGTRADIGAFPYNFLTPKIVINEINYNSSNEFDSGDWVELYNNQNEDVDLSNWYFQDENDAHKYVFKEGTILKANSFIVLCEKEINFKKIFPSTKNYLTGMDFGFSGSGELLRLFNDEAKLVDSVRYDDEFPWPVEGDGSGHSIELINPDYDNSKGYNWKASAKIGTPGEINSCFTDVNVSHSNNHTMHYKVSYNPISNDYFIIFDKIIYQPCELAIYDLLGNEIFNIKYNKLNDGTIRINLQSYYNGIYFYVLKFENDIYRGKIIKTN